MRQTQRHIGGAALFAAVLFSQCWGTSRAAEGDSGPRIELDAPVIVSQAPANVRKWGPWQFPSIQRLPDGRLQVGFHIAEDSATAYGVRPGFAISNDDGKTWRVVEPDQAPPTWTSKILSLPNGDLLRQIPLRSLKLSDIQGKLPPPLTALPGGYSEKITVYPADKMPRELSGWRFARQTHGSGNWEEETAKVNIPGEVRTATSGVLVLPWIHRIRIAPDGSLWGEGHLIRMVDGALRNRSAVYFLRSSDQGHTWNLLGEIPYLPDKKADKYWNKRHGFTEPDVAFLPSGSILCLMRTTDGNGVGPLYVSRSTDRGMTWSQPSVFDELGVWPMLLTLQNGVTLASYGRPGLYLRATNDPTGKSWGPRITVVKPGQQHKDTCSYSDLIALARHTALIVYSDFTYPNHTGRLCKTILARRLRIYYH